MLTRNHKRRLIKMIAFLRALPRSQFNLDIVAEKTSCGTVACACGWTPKIFPQTFKWLSPKNDLPGYLTVRFRKGKGKNDSWAIHLVGKYLGLNTNQILKIFLPENGYKTPKQVAARLQRVLDSNGKSYATAA